MKDCLVYKGFLGSVHFNAQDEVFYGRIEGIDDLISFEGRSVDELKAAFHEAVSDYAELCKDASKKMEKSYKGSFNVRIHPDVHKKAKQLATMKGISLNQFIQKAVEDKVREETPDYL
ncbi:MAG TPA: type II toxin-antitoxin system HicB family antitoxin [Rectinemataceae bacterium]